MKIALVIPCYNESTRLNAQAFKSFEKTTPEIDFYFVNDGSKDHTLEILHRHFEKDHVIDLQPNRGKGEAVREGMEKVFHKDQYDYIGFLDADLSTPLEELQSFLAFCKKGFKVIIGSRILRLGGNIERKWYRHYPSRVSATLISNALELPVYDTQCGAKLFHKSLIPLIIKEPFLSKWIFDVEIFFRLKKHSSLKLEDYQEIPLRRWSDVGDSHVRFKDFIRSLMDLIQMIIKYR